MAYLKIKYIVGSGSNLEPLLTLFLIFWGDMMIQILKLTNPFQEEKIAEWTHRRNGSDDFVFCSHCNSQALHYLMDSGYYKNYITKYCPRCGYRMKYKGVLL